MESAASLRVHDNDLGLCFYYAIGRPMEISMTEEFKGFSFHLEILFSGNIYSET